ncbi:hypothetical protein [Chloroflexus sp. Y-396-1]|uniref:hypothetical protein n=1 Tax=Chloroflexus sp. Y-396-1 TaxID=867845 RepID=UPI00048E5144|nr:hypothetical protein [Chloroflexus sp. Y-396-1]
MSVLAAEKIYSYPWRRRIWLSMSGNLLVFVSLLAAVYQLARGLLTNESIARWVQRNTLLQPFFEMLSPPPQDVNEWMVDTLVVLLWVAGGLLAALVLLNALPTIRVGGRGLLVAFAGGWLPVAWEELHQIHVTGDEAGERFVLLVIPAKSAKRLTGWHRLYGLLYGTTIRPAFLISSGIREFDHLLNTILQEHARAIRRIEGAQPLDVDEQRRSPLFGLFLRRTTATTRTEVHLPPTTESDVVATIPRLAPAGIIPPVAALLIFVLGILHYRSYWERALALLFPTYRSNPALLWVSRDPVYQAIFESYQGVGVPFFGIANRPDLPAPFWLLVAAHLMMGLILVSCAAILVAVPTVATAGQHSLTIRYVLRGRNSRFKSDIPWPHISACQVIDLGFGKQIMFVQSERLPWLCRFCGLIVTGQWKPGVVLVGTMSHWPDLIARCAERLSHIPPINNVPRFQLAAFMPNLQLFGQPVATTKALSVERKTAAGPTGSRLWASVRAMALVALPLGLMFALPALIDGNRWPNLGIIIGGFGFWMAGVLEWPLIVLISFLIQGNFTEEQEQAHIFTLYPLIQLPRLLPMLLALIGLLVNLPGLAVICWFVALAIAYWVTAALWVEVYEWDGAQAIIGGLLPVIWHFFVMTGFWLLR